METKNIPQEIVQSINEALALIEKNNAIRIILCVEAGSRSWGIPSKDSDYDVRFIYVHAPEKYAAMTEPLQELDVRVNNIDAHGIDIRNAFMRLKKNDPSVYEWLESGIVYKIDYKLEWIIQDAANYYFDTYMLARYYYGMAKKIYQKEMKWAEDIRVKKYLYCLRSILCGRYVVENKKRVPLDFKELVRYMPEKYEDELDKLISEKKETIENATTNKKYGLEDTVLEELTALEKMLYGTWSEDEKGWEKANELLFEYVRSSPASGRK